jgi:uncharacterized glyoxalase superfamily protein PhnB
VRQRAVPGPAARCRLRRSTAATQKPAEPTQNARRSRPIPATFPFECDDLDERYTRLSTAGYRFTSPPTDQSWLWREALLVDPDGQQICLFHAGVNRTDPPWRLVESL